MGRAARQLPDGCSFHITLRCNSRAILIGRGVRRDLLLAVLRRGAGEVPLPLQGICLMANHLHLLLEPQQGRDLPRIMQWFGWYSAMALNRLTGRCGHFWEARYFSTPIDPADRRRVLATLRYIHANPKAAGVRKGFHDPWSNYGHYERLEGDGLSEWHPAFLQLAPTLEGCARRYAHYCRQYRPRPSRRRKAGGGAGCCSGMEAVARRAPPGSRGWQRASNCCHGLGRICRCRWNGISWRRTSGGPMEPGEAHGMGSEVKRRGRSLSLAAKQKAHQWDRQDGCWMLRGREKRAPIAAGEGSPGGQKVPGIAEAFEGIAEAFEGIAEASDQANGAVEKALLVPLIRFLSLRLKPKAAAAPTTGKGPGTAAAGGGTGVKVRKPLSSSRGMPSPSNESNRPNPREPKRSSICGSKNPTQLVEMSSPPDETTNPPGKEGSGDEVKR